ncbi:Serine proteinase stubble-like protein, partial [Dinothrombium tinctorium]
RLCGGEQASENQFPWQVGLLRKIHGEFEHIGGDVIISDRWILSAAHVFHGKVSEYKGIIGSLNISNPVVTVNFKKLIKHRNFDSRTYENDIALLRTTKAMELYPKQKHSNSVCLTRSYRHLKGKILVSGWGEISDEGDFSHHLMYGDLDLLNDKPCEKNYEFYNRTLMVCIGELSGAKDSCFGDSGGPAVANRTNRYFLIGIVSFGKRSGCDIPGVPGVYTRVTHYIKWIEEKTKLRF